MSTATTQPPERDPIMERLEDQIAGYDRKGLANPRTYKRIKIVEILAAAGILRPRRTDLGGGVVRKILPENQAEVENESEEDDFAGGAGHAF